MPQVFLAKASNERKWMDRDSAPKPNFGAGGKFVWKLRQPRLLLTHARTGDADGKTWKKTSCQGGTLSAKYKPYWLLNSVPFFQVQITAHRMTSLINIPNIFNEVFTFLLQNLCFFLPKLGFGTTQIPEIETVSESCFSQN